MYEMVYGFPPFASDCPLTTYSNICQWESKLEFPAETPISCQAVTAIKSLLTSAEQRVSSLAEMTRLSWLSNIDWTNLRERPAAIPVHITSIDDTSSQQGKGEEVLVGFGPNWKPSADRG